MYIYICVCVCVNIYIYIYIYIYISHITHTYICVYRESECDVPALRFASANDSQTLTCLVRASRRR